LSIVWWAALSLRLAGLISFFAEEQDAIGYPLVIDGNLKSIPSETRSSRFAGLENIEIGNFTRYDSDPNSVQDPSFRTRPTGQRNKQNSGLVLAWPEIRAMNSDFLWVVDILAHFYSKSTSVADFVCGRLPIILVFDSDVRPITGIRLQDGDVGDIDVSPQLASYRDLPARI
jgi:hypothetical protein